MSFVDWLNTNPRNNPVQPWGTLHIIVLLSCIAVIVLLAVFLRKKSEKVRYFVVFGIAMGILFFELFRRTVHLCNPDLGQPLQWILMPRPWCAISCWLVIISVFVKKKFLYNFAAITGILNAIIFFAYHI